MPHITVTLTIEEYCKLVEIAVAERRPVPWQGEVMLRRLLSETPSPHLETGKIAIARPKHEVVQQ